MRSRRRRLPPSTRNRARVLSSALSGSAEWRGCSQRVPGAKQDGGARRTAQGPERVVVVARGPAVRVHEGLETLDLRVDRPPSAETERHIYPQLSSRPTHAPARGSRSRGCRPHSGAGAPSPLASSAAVTSGDRSTDGKLRQLASNLGSADGRNDTARTETREARSFLDDQPGDQGLARGLTLWSSCPDPGVLDGPVGSPSQCGQCGWLPSWQTGASARWLGSTGCRVPQVVAASPQRRSEPRPTHRHPHQQCRNNLRQAVAFHRPVHPRACVHLRRVDRSARLGERIIAASTDGDENPQRQSLTLCGILDQPTSSSPMR